MRELQGTRSKTEQGSYKALHRARQGSATLAWLVRGVAVNAAFSLDRG